MYLCILRKPRIQISRQGSRRQAQQCSDSWLFPPASCQLKVENRISQKEDKLSTKGILLCKTNQESEQTIASDYAEFAYKLIKTTRELLQETDSGNDVKLFHWGQVAIDIFLWQIQAQGNIFSNNFT